MGGSTYGDEGEDEERRRWKESGERETAARNGVGGQSVRQRNGRVCEGAVGWKTKGLCFSWS